MVLSRRIGWTHLWHEAKRLVRFVIIGGLSFVSYAALYALLSRWLWTAGNRTLLSFISSLIISVANFLAHRHFTFQVEVEHRHPHQMFRYVLVLVTAMGLQSGLFWVGHEFFHLFDFAVLFIVSLLCAAYTYLLHRFYTFHHRPPAV